LPKRLAPCNSLTLFGDQIICEEDLVALTKRGNGVLVKPKRAVDSDDVLTLAEAKRLRLSLKQTSQGKTRLWAEIERELRSEKTYR
jgi:hypothetical protein